MSQTLYTIALVSTSLVTIPLVIKACGWVISKIPAPQDDPRVPQAQVSE